MKQTYRKHRIKLEKKCNLSARNNRWFSSANSGSSTSFIRPSARVAATSRILESAAWTERRDLDARSPAARQLMLRAAQSRRSMRRQTSGSCAAALHVEQARDALPERRAGAPTRVMISTRRSCCSSAQGLIGGVAMGGCGLERTRLLGSRSENGRYPRVPLFYFTP